jgi:ribose-phosphate pyrophosphokinase
MHRESNSGSLKVFTGNANPALAQEICRLLQAPLGKATVKKFSDGETMVEISENIRGTDVFVIQSTCNPVNDHLMELLILIDALKRASAWRVTAVLPYYGYARQDRKVAPRAPITAKLVADLLSVAGAHRVLAMDLHAGQIQGFFDIPVDHLYATPVLLDHVRSLSLRDVVVVSPDAGGVERARSFAKKLGAGLAIIDKRRVAPNVVAEDMRIIGDVAGRPVVVVDDMIDTAGTLVQGLEALKKAGARPIFACAAHPVFSGPAIARIAASPCEQVIVTDSIPLAPEARACPKVVQLSVAALLGEAIKRIHDDESVSSLFV